MATVRVADIVNPTVYATYLMEEIVNVSAFVRSGIIRPDSRINVAASSGAKTFNLPFYKELSGNDEVLGTGSGATDSDLSIAGIETGTDVAVLFQRGKAWGSEDLAMMLNVQGSDPLQAIISYTGSWWADKEQDTLISILKGVFADNETNDSGDLVHDISTEDGNNAVDSNKISPEAIITASTKLGDAAGKIIAMCIHSTVYSRLQITNMIDFTANNIQNIGWGTYLGKTVIVDDDMPTASGTTSGTKYTSYLFARGSIARGEGLVKVPVETDRDSLGGVDILVNRRAFSLHPIGVAFTGASASISASTPTNTEVESEAFWNRVYEKKNIGLIKLVTNG